MTEKSKKLARIAPWTSEKDQSTLTDQKQPTQEEIERKRKARSYVGRPMKVCITAVVSEPLLSGSNLESIPHFAVRLRSKYARLLNVKYVSVIVVG